MLLSGKYPKGASIEEVFDAALEIFLDKNSPKRRSERRAEKNSRNSRKEKKGQQRADTRNISKPIRDSVMVRDDLSCTYVSEDSIRCTCTWDLESDHITPRGKGGESTSENSRVLCRPHNMLEAEKAYGKEHMKGFIAT